MLCSSRLDERKDYHHVSINGNLGESSPKPVPFTLGSVISADGTTIGYRTCGQGPAVVILHGSNVSSQNFTQLAEHLSDAFTLYLPDRRGRGLSGPFGSDYCIQREVEDLDALLTKTGAQMAFGVSAG